MIAHSILNCKSAIFLLREIAKLQFCRFPAFFHSRQYTLTEAETGNTKKRNDLKSSVPRQKESAPFRFRGLRKSIATRALQNSAKKRG